MQDTNIVVIVGRLTRDPELRTTRNDKSVCEMGVAVNESVPSSGGRYEDRASFFDVTVWGAAGETCAQYLSKGKRVAITGRISQDRWENGEGEKRSKVKITANLGGVQFLSPRDEDDPAPRSREQHAEDDPDDDIPF